MRVKGFIVAILGVLFLSSCNTAGVKSYQSAQQITVSTKQDKRIWNQADEFDEQLDNQGPVYRNQELTQYLNEVALKLYPEFTGKIKIHVLQHPSFNAFALPNGSIYMHTGLLAKLENEAELAIVLAHEVAHFVHRHGLKQRYNVEAMRAISIGLTVATGIPLLGDVLAASSVYGYSRDLEREADREGYQRLIDSGYDASQASRVFEKMLAEIKALDIDEPVLFSSHPKLQERIDSFKTITKELSKKGGILNSTAYVQKIDHLYRVNLEDELEHQQYKKVIYWLELTDSPYKNVEAAEYYLGAAYLLRNEEKDKKKALEKFLLSIEKAPDFGPAYRELGRHYYQKSEYNKANEYFTRYLELEPNAKDKGYINKYIKEMDLKS